ncbi:MAG TPA: hypothetical protein VMY42_07725 [Thermoguttaceae bacterium]|nr:hypothetical protein [Thermoguttaceae bacterium]
MSDSVGRLPGVDGPCTVGGPVGLGRGFGIAVTPGLPLPIEGGVVGVGLGRDCPRTRPRISANDGRSGAVGGRLMVGGAVGGRLMVGGAVGGRLMVGGAVGAVGVGREFAVGGTPGVPPPIEGGVVGVGLGRDCPKSRPRISANDGRSGAVGGRLTVGGAVGGRLMVGGAVGGRLMVGGAVGGRLMVGGAVGGRLMVGGAVGGRLMVGGAVGVGREFAVGDTPGLPLPIDGGVGLGRDCPKSRWRTSASEGRLPEMGGAERFDDEKEGGRIVGAGAGVDGLGTA